MERVIPTLPDYAARDAHYLWRMFRMDTMQITARLNLGQREDSPLRFSEAQVFNSLCALREAVRDPIGAAAAMTQVFHLPWPPTANSMWRHVRAGQHYLPYRETAYCPEHFVLCTRPVGSAA